MLKLEKILAVQKKRLCFCGQPLVGDFCEIHGTDIRVSLAYITARFRFDTTRDNPVSSDERFFDLSLPRNQFFLLFSKLHQKQFNQARQLRQISYQK